ncbi:hypothetical protein [Lactiplantibacillus paraxiangfangensis]|uniref:hypothetical protein n=1 Tax=Lactiplantibacillus paraxiangfangensis TaxID=3076224 RepID=UPI0030C684F7
MKTTWTLKFAKTLVGKKVGAWGDVVEADDVKDLHSLLVFCNMYLAVPYDHTYIDQDKQAVVFEMYC